MWSRTVLDATMIDDETLKNIPRSPGVYLMESASGKVLYVGKAQNLKARVSQYFGNVTDGRASVPFLMRKVEKLEWIVTNNEKEALILENTLIKKHRPRYNVRLSDDKTYLSLRIDICQDFPRVEVMRIRSKPADGVLYFGPYSSALAIRQTVRQLQRLFPLRTCSDSKLCRQRGRPCLDYQIGRCSGPCFGLISKEDYREIVDQVVLFLRGRNDELIEKLTLRMEIEAGQLKFEEARKTRDMISAVQQSMEKQQVFSTKWRNQDVFGLYREGDEIDLVVMHIRDGMLQDSTTQQFTGTVLPEGELIGSLLSQMYDEGRYIPEEIVIPVELSDASVREELLSERRGGSVRLVSPKRGERRSLIEMARKNAESVFALNHDREQMRASTLEQMEKRLRLKRLPRRIECFDISTIQGRLSVGSMVVFTDGTADKGEYRRYRIKTVPGVDDYAMMREVMERRVRRGKEEENLPDLIIVDGGKGQLNITRAVLSELGVRDIGLASIAKDKSDWVEGKSKAEKVYLPNVKDAIRLHENSPVLFLIQEIRDEAHRFAITYHKKLRKKSTMRSILDDIPGIGPKRKNALLRAFGSLKRIREASAEELSKVKGMSGKAAGILHGYLNRDGGQRDDESV
jgi:excinuclease ABC subunit C